MNNPKLQHYFLLVLIIGAFLLAFYIFRPFLGPLVLAAVFAVIFQPLYRSMLRVTRGRWPGIAAIATVIASIICVLLPLTLLGMQIVAEAGQLYESLADGTGRSYLESALQRTDEFLGSYFPQLQGFSTDFSENIQTYSRQALEWLIRNIGAAFSSIASLFIGLIIFFIALFYFLRDGKAFKQTIARLSPLPDTDDQVVFDRLELAVNSVVKGNLAIALIQGTLTAIGFTIFGVPNGVLWGTVAAVAALIPGLGTAVVLVPGIIFLFLADRNLPALGLIIWGVLAVGLIDNFLGPKLVGRGMKLHPLLVLLAVIGGIALFGPLGVFLGPLSLSLLIALLAIYSHATGTIEKS